MKYWMRLAVFAFVSLTVRHGQSQETDVTAIRSMFVQWTTLYNAGAFEELVSKFYTEDAALMSPKKPIHMGKAAILDAYKAARAADEEHCDSCVVEDIRVSSDLAVARGADIGTTRPRSGGQTVSYNLKWLIVLERQPDGRWKWIYEIWNENPLPAASEPEGDG